MHFFERSAREILWQHQEPEYPPSFERYRTDKKGSITWHGWPIHLTESLDQDLVGVDVSGCTPVQTG